MAVRIVRGYAGTGKTEFVLHRIVDVFSGHPFARIWVILATRRQEFAFRQRLITANRHKRAIFNVEFFDFYTLYQHLLDQSGQPQRLLSDAAQLTLLRNLLVEHQSELEHFRTIAHTLGFAKVVGDFIFELKQNQMRPEAYLEVAQTARDRDLAHIYALYQAQMQAHHLVDKEGQGWLALQALSNSENLADNLDLLIVDGFDQFTTVQSHIISHLVARSVDTYVTLTEVPELQRTVGRRFAEAYQELVAPLNGVEVIDLDADSVWQDFHVDVVHIARQVFRYPPTTKASAAGIRFVEAPDESGEVAAVFRHMKRLLLDGTSPDEILIVVRNWSTYQSHLSAAQQKYNLPLTLHYSQQLASEPVIVALLAILNLHSTDFRRRDLLAALRSPYFQIPGFDDEAVGLLDRVSLLFQVAGTRKRWLSAVNQASKYRSTDDLYSDRDREISLDNQLIGGLKVDLEAFMDVITPLAEDTPRGYVDWLTQLIGVDPEFAGLTHDDSPSVNDLETSSLFTLNVIGCIRRSNTPHWILARDLQAMQAFKHLLHSMVAAHELVATVVANARDQITWDEFYSELVTLVNTTEIEQPPERQGRILITTAANARGLPHDHVFILGLSTGGFPLTLAEDPLYLDQERTALKINGRPLLTRAQRASDDALFYELVSLARASLTLSRPAQQDGTQRAPSPFWRAVSALFTDANQLIQRDRLRIGELPPLLEVATIDDVAVSLASRLNDPAETLSDDTLSALAWMQQVRPELLAHIAYVRHVEQLRIRQPGHHSGYLSNPQLIYLVNEMLSPSHVWSASQLNDYGLCGFRFFAKRILQLESLDEPEDGMDVAQRGQIIHTILERTYRDIQSEELAISSGNMQTALAFLGHHIEVVFSEAPEKLGFAADQLWAHEQQYIAGLLNRFVRADFADADDNTFYKKFPYIDRAPFLLEQSFGYEDVPVWLDLDTVGEIRIRGFIDRIDRVNGDQVVVIDYKTGGAPGLSDLRDGRNFQLLIYLEGAKALMRRYGKARAVAGGVFWRLTGAEVSGALMPESDPKHHQALQAARNKLAENIRRGRAGDFRTSPNKLENGRCIRYCEFSQLCRVNHTES